MAKLDVIDELLRDELCLNAQTVRRAVAPEEKAGCAAVVGKRVAEVTDLLAERVTRRVHGC